MASALPTRQTTVVNLICPGCDKALRLTVQFAIEHRPDGYWYVTANDDQFTQAVRAHAAGHIAFGV